MGERPQPVLVNGGAAVVAGVLVPLFARWGIDADGVSQVLAYALTVVSAITGLAQLWSARAKVTPIAAPRNNHGEALTPGPRGT